MKDLTNISVLREMLRRHGITLSKGMGQNFLINPSVCPRMAEESGVDGNAGALEIGPGVGVLTAELAGRAKRVAAIELDRRLEPLLKENLDEFSNVDLIFGDALELDLHNIIRDRFSDCDKVIVCANLPYYITSPIIMRLLEQRLPVDAVTVMVQREAAERMCAQVGSREAGAITVAVRYFSEPRMLSRVSPGSFLPPPKVESAVMRLDVRDPEAVGWGLEAGAQEVFWKLVKAGFGQRRKTLPNAAGSIFGKELVAEALAAAGLSESARIEQLSMEQLFDIARELYQRKTL